MQVSDQIELPPLRREFWSPGRDFVFVVETLDGWNTMTPQAHLSDARQPRRAPLWQKPLVQQFGPREAVVGPTGRVLLVDEWINVTSRWALMLLDVQGRVVASHDHAAVMSALGAPAEDVVRLARSGTWLTSGPQLSGDGATALVHAGGRTLTVQLSDGRLSATP